MPGCLNRAGIQFAIENACHHALDGLLLRRNIIFMFNFNIIEESGMCDRQSMIIGNQAQFANESCQFREIMSRGRSKPRKRMETPRELMALISYLRQQEAGVLDAMQRLQDAT